MGDAFLCPMPERCREEAIPDCVRTGARTAIIAESALSGYSKTLDSNEMNGPGTQNPGCVANAKSSDSRNAWMFRLLRLIAPTVLTLPILLFSYFVWGSITDEVDMHSNTRFEDCVERWFCWPILSPTIAASDLCDTWIDNQAPDKYPMIFMGGLFLLPMVIWGFTIECFLRTSRRQRIWLLLALLVLAVWMGRTLPNSAPLSEAAHVSRERVVGVQMAGAWVVFLSVGFFMVASNKRNQRLRNR